MIKDEELLRSFNEDSSRKKIKFSFDGFELGNSDITLEELEFFESINSSDNIAYGSCEMSSLKFQVINEEFKITDLIDRWFNAEIMSSTKNMNFSYLIPYRYKNLTKKTFDDEEFTKQSFDDVKFVKKTFDNGIRSDIFKSLLPLSLEPSQLEKYIVVNYKEPYIEYYQYDGSRYETVSETVQPAKPVSAVSYVDGILYAYHKDEDYKSVYRVTDNQLVKQDDEPLTLTERKSVPSNTYNTYYDSTLGISYDVDLECNVYVFKELHLGRFKVKEALKEDEVLINVTAYDKMILFEEDGSEWFNTLNFENMTLSSLLTSLCSKLNVPLSVGTFINSNMPVTKNANVTGTTYRDILSWIGEASASFPKIDRTKGDVLVLKTISTSKQADYKMPYFIPPIEYSEYMTKKIEKLQIRMEENDIGVIVGEGTNTYVIEDNPLLYPKSEGQLRPYAENIFNAIKDISYRSVQCETNGNPLIVLGDLVSVDTADENVPSVNILVLQRTMNGINGLEDSFETNGTISREPNSYVNRSILKLSGKMAKIELSVDGIRTEISDLEEGTTSKFEQLNKEISLKVEAGDVEQMLSVSLEGVVFKSNLTDGKTTISGSNIKTGSINADLIKTGTIEAIDINGSTITGSQIKGSTIMFGTSTNYGKLHSEENGSIVIQGTKFIQIDAGTKGLQIESPTAINDSLGVVYDCDISGDLTVVGTSYLLGGTEFDDINASNLYLTNSLYLDGEEIYYSYSSGGFWFGDSVCPNTTRGSYDLGTDGYRWGSVYLEYDPDVSSDIRLKEDIKEFDLANIIDEVKIYEFTYKNDERKKKRVGILANTESLLNEHSDYFINEPRVLLDNDGNAGETFYSSNPHNLFYANIKATQEARAEIRKMKEEIEILRKEIAELKREKGEAQ